MNIETLLNNITSECESVIKMVESLTGEEVEIDELSEEEDANYIEDSQLAIEMTYVTHPILMVNAKQILSARCIALS